MDCVEWALMKLHEKMIVMTLKEVNERHRHVVSPAVSKKTQCLSTKPLDRPTYFEIEEDIKAFADESKKDDQTTLKLTEEDIKPFRSLPRA
ncbi:hypothetical protein ACLOJK_032617 [Asimina triloba]